MAAVMAFQESPPGLWVITQKAEGRSDVDGDNRLAVFNLQLIGQKWSNCITPESVTSPRWDGTLRVTPH
jgi:hypothetical protein